MSESFCDATVVATCANGAERHGRLADILDHYLRELERGVPPRVDALIEENPDLADELRDYVESLHLLHGMTAGLRQKAAPEMSISEHARKQLGDYEILRELGRGGMGIVYEARQLSLNRKVALKVLPFAAVLDEKQLARFRNEAQAAAQLHHPHIVPVFAVGQDRGVHFYAMQYIEGQSLDKARDDLFRQLSSPGTALLDSATSPSARDGLAASGDTRPVATAATKASTQSRDYCRAVAQLGVQAAEALHHAHEFGIVHRDVKPSNLLLDQNRKLWVTDFGLARVQSCADVTLSGDVIGTLRYMSPEQAAGANALVDPRSDLYALGATLYELLTLQHAHDGENREQLRHQIEHEEPRPPRAINPAIPQDLETIVLAAMSKSREDRYDSAEDMADDLSRFLQGRPTMARRPTLLERGARWLRRHQRAALAASLVLALVATLSTAGMFLIATEKARTEEAKIAAEANLRDARRNLARAEEHFSQAREVVDRFGSGLAGQLAELPGSEPIRRALLRDTLAYYRQFINHAADDPDLGEDLARTCFEAAQIAEQLGQRNEAQALYQQALASYAELAIARPDEEQLVAHQATCHNNLGLLLATQNDTEAAVDAYRQAIELARRLAERYPERAEFTRSLAETHGNLGLLWRQSGHVDEARQSLNEAVRLLRALIDGDSKAARPRHDLAIIYNNLSYIERQTDWDAAEISCRRAIAILEELAGEANESSAYVYDLALCHNNLGAIHSHRHELSDAASAYRQAIDLFEQLAGRAPAIVRYRRDLAVSLNNLGQLQSRQQDWTAAQSVFERAGEILGKLVGVFPDELQFRSSLAGVLNNQGLVLEQIDDYDASLKHFARAIEHQRFAVDRAPQTPEYRNFLSKHYFNYARALRRAGRPDDATDVTLERRRLWADNPDRLFQVSVELAEAFGAPGGGDPLIINENRQQIADEALSTLKLAVDAGYKLEGTLDEIEALASLRGHPRFDELAREIEIRRVDSADHEGGR